MIPHALPQAQPTAVALSSLSVARVPTRLAALQPGQILTLVGIDGAGLRAAAETAPDLSRTMLVLDVGDARTAAHIVARILDDLAALALAVWPRWSDLSDAFGVLAIWRREAGRLAAAGRPPRFRRIPPRVELRQLLDAIEPAGPVLVATLDIGRPLAAAAAIAALEWCAGAGAGVAILCPARPPLSPPFDRILYGALDVTPPPAPPVLERLIVPHGKAHGGSDIERRVQAAILGDVELAPLFAYNRCIPTGAPGFAPRVDLVWEDGRVVVELDGPEHQGDPKFGQDRHRDYELLVSGYLVLRLTNTEIATDLARSIEKIRRVARLRKERA